MQIIFLDRDGVINHNNRSKENGPYYTLSPEQFIWFEGSKEAMVRLQKKGYLVHVVTSQNCISSGLCTKEIVEEIHSHMNLDIEEAGGNAVDVSIIYGVKESDQLRAEAKASAVLAFYSKQAIPLEPISECYVVGDTESDIIAGRLAGCKTVHVELNYTSEKDKHVDIADIHVSSLAEFVDIICGEGN